MYARLLKPPERGSFFLFGPRGTGKSSWVGASLPGAVYIDLLDSNQYLDLLASPARLGRRLPPGYTGWVILDEVQKVPALLDEVHRLIEAQALRFALTGSSARALRRGGVNLLAGRAATLAMHPLLAAELAADFDLRRAVDIGLLPLAWTAPTPTAARTYLRGYVGTYLREEVQHEGLARNLAAFSRFLEAASFSQGSPLNVAAVARECQVERKAVEGWFGVLDDLMLAARLPVFTRRARREVVAHPKFYFFDAGVYRAIRPRGPLDSSEEIDGAALETLLYQEMRGLNDALELGYSLSYWRTRSGLEVDFVLYGERGLHAFDVKRTSHPHEGDTHGLREFLAEYPESRAWLLHGGERRFRDGPVEFVPFGDAMRELRGWIE